MWLWVLFGYTIFIAVLLGVAVFVALFGRDPDHRSAGYKVLKLIWFGVTGPGGVAALVVKLNEVGLL